MRRAARPSQLGGTRALPGADAGDQAGHLRDALGREAEQRVGARARP